jgi:TRAP-type transport system periplasmic protein
MRYITKTLSAGLLVATGAFGSAGAADDLEVPVATWGSPNHINVSTFVGKLEEAAKANSEGRITVKHYPSGQLAEDADMPVAIPAGKVKFGWVTLNGWSGMTQDVKIADAPTGLTMEQMEAATDGDAGIKAVLDRELQAKGVKLLAVTNLGPTVIVTNEKALTPGDFEGKKIRVYSEGTAMLAQALGAAPVKLPFADVYTALQRGTIDGAITGFQGVESQKMYEVASNLLIPASFTGTGYQGWVANLDWWNGLSDEDRAILSNAIQEAESYSREKIIEDRNKLAEHYRSKGMTVIELTPDMPEYKAWVESTRPLMEQAEKTLSPDIIAPVKKQQAMAN